MRNYLFSRTRQSPEDEWQKISTILSNRIHSLRNYGFEELCYCAIIQWYEMKEYYLVKITEKHLKRCKK